MSYIRAYRDGWRAQVQKDGVRASKTFRTKREASAWATEQEAKKSLSKGYTLEKACAHYLSTVSIQKRDAVAWETSRFRYFKEYFGPVLLDDITSEKLGHWRDWRLTGDENNKPVKGSTVLREINLFRNLFKLAHKEWKWIEASPFDGVRLPDDEDPRQVVWRWSQILRIMRAARRTGGKTWEVAQVFHIALRTGMRLQEAIAAPMGFDKRRRVVDLPPTKTAKNGETVPLTAEAYRLLLKIKPFEVGPNEASTLFSQLCKHNLISGLQFRDSRATALTLMSRKMDILTLARISRHKNLDLLRSTYYREQAEEISIRLQPVKQNKSNWQD